MAKFKSLPKLLKEPMCIRATTLLDQEIDSVKSFTQDLREWSRMIISSRQSCLELVKQLGNMCVGENVYTLDESNVLRVLTCVVESSLLETVGFLSLQKIAKLKERVQNFNQPKKTIKAKQAKTSKTNIYTQQSVIPSDAKLLNVPHYFDSADKAFNSSKSKTKSRKKKKNQNSAGKQKKPAKVLVVQPAAKTKKTVKKETKQQKKERLAKHKKTHEAAQQRVRSITAIPSTVGKKKKVYAEEENCK